MSREKSKTKNGKFKSGIGNAITNSKKKEKQEKIYTDFLIIK